VNIIQKIKIETNKVFKYEKNLWLTCLVVVSVVYFFTNLAIFSQFNNLILDILNPSLQNNSNIVVVGIGDKSLQKLGAWPWTRDKFASFIQKVDATSDPKVLAIDVLFAEKREGDKELVQAINNANTNIVLASKIEGGYIILPVFMDEIPKASAGYIDVLGDMDGKIRRHRYGFKNQQNANCQNSFALEIVKANLNQSDQKNIDCQNPEWLEIKYFNYPNQNFPILEFSDVLENEELQKSLNNKIVLVGVSTKDIKSDLTDIFTGIDGQKTNGVEINAALVNSVLLNRFQEFLGLWESYILVLLIAMFLIFIFKKVHNSLINLVVLISTIIVFHILGVFIYDFGINLNFVQTSITSTAVLVYFISWQYLTTDKQKQFIEHAFSKYLSPSLLKDLLDNPDKLNLQGERKVMTVLFADLIGFTKLSEELESVKLAKILNKYLEAMTKVILKRNGTVDKYIGDAVMTFWNAPLEDEKHQWHALETAVEMTEVLGDIRQIDGCGELMVGIGVNTGDMVVGNFGSNARFDYTVIGDNVNLASRLESLTRKYGVEILVSGATIEGLNFDESQLLAIKMDRANVKGKKIPVDIYNIVKRNKENEYIKEIYEKGFEYYRKKEFEKASQVWALIKNYQPTQLLQSRFDELKKIEDWDGVWNWQEK
jgi:adenylate cyclase